MSSHALHKTSVVVDVMVFGTLRGVGGGKGNRTWGNAMLFSAEYCLPFVGQTYILVC